MIFRKVEFFYWPGNAWIGTMPQAASASCIREGIGVIRVPYRRSDEAVLTFLASALVFLIFLFLLPTPLPAQESLKTYQTRYATITYAQEKDLYNFTRNTGTGLSFLRESQEKNPLLAKTQVDKIVETICSLLDMHPPNLHFGITLYQNQSEVTTAYYRVSSATTNGYANNTTDTAPIAFYAHNTRNIAVAIDNITDYILAHEIAHAIISAHFVPPPPHRMQEILCQYMDKYFRER
jgi:hypothetical protein